MDVTLRPRPARGPRLDDAPTRPTLTVGGTVKFADSRGQRGRRVTSVTRAEYSMLDEHLSAARREGLGESRS